MPAEGPGEGPGEGPQFLGELSAIPEDPQFNCQHPCLVYIQRTHKNNNIFRIMGKVSFH